MTTVDILVVGAHPDDAEVGMGGLIHKMVSQGYSVGILDLTQGELASRGSPAERAEEAAASAEILGVTRRECAKLKDGRIANTWEQQRAVVPFIRSFKPRILISHMSDDRHPDHSAAHDLVRDANYFAGLTHMDPDAHREPHRVMRRFFYRVYGDPTPPQLVMDISEHMDAKLEALQQYTSQFYNPGYEGFPTYVSSPEFWDFVRTRAAYWGNRIGVKYGEPLYITRPVGIDSLPMLETIE